MITEKGEIQQGLASHQPGWQLVCDLIKEGRYERAAEFLDEAQAASQRLGDAGRARILAAASSVCMACHQCRAETERHQQAYRESGQREQELALRLQAILGLAYGQPALDPQEENGDSTGLAESAVDTPAPDISEPREGPGLWQRIQSKLGRRPELVAEPPKTPVAVTTGMEQEEVPPVLVIYCLGPFRVYQGDQLISDWPSGKGKSILKYMLGHRERPIGKEVLMDLFWRDADPNAARNSLNSRQRYAYPKTWEVHRPSG